MFASVVFWGEAGAGCRDYGTGSCWWTVVAGQ